MSGKSFFQSVFCEGKVNNYVKVVENQNEDDENELVKNIFLKEDSIETNKDTTNDLINETNETLGIVFNKDIISSEVVSLDKAGFSHDGIGSTSGMLGSNEINEHRNIDATKSPVVSGLIFDDKAIDDEAGFVISSTVIDDEKAEDMDIQAANLINMLKHEEEKEVYNEPVYAKDKEESEIDMPMI